MWGVCLHSKTDHKMPRTPHLFHSYIDLKLYKNFKQFKKSLRYHVRYTIQKLLIIIAFQIFRKFNLQ